MKQLYRSLRRALPRAVPVLLLALLVLPAAGCSKRQEGQASEPAALKPVDGTSGEALFDLRCRQCHALYGRGGSVAPDLTHTFAQRSHDYLVQMINEPARLYPGTIMPAFQGQMSNEQLESLIDFLDTSKPLPWKQRKKHRWQKDR